MVHSETGSLTFTFLVGREGFKQVWAVCGGDEAVSAWIICPSIFLFSKLIEIFMFFE